MSESRPDAPTEWPTFDDETLLPKIIDIIAKEGMVDRDKIEPTATIESLELDSIEVVMILNGVEEVFDVYVSMEGDIAEARNLSELVSAMAKAVDAHAETAGTRQEDPV